MHPLVEAATKQLQASYADYQPFLDQYGVTPRILGTTVSACQHSRGIQSSECANVLPYGNDVRPPGADS